MVFSPTVSIGSPLTRGLYDPPMLSSAARQPRARTCVGAQSSPSAWNVDGKAMAKAVFPHIDTLSGDGRRPKQNASKEAKTLLRFFAAWIQVAYIRRCPSIGISAGNARPGCVYYRGQRWRETAVAVCVSCRANQGERQYRRAQAGGRLANPGAVGRVGRWLPGKIRARLSRRISRAWRMTELLNPSGTPEFVFGFRKGGGDISGSAPVCA